MQAYRSPNRCSDARRWLSENRPNSRARAFLPNPRGINISRLIECERSYFFFGRTVEHECFSRRCNAVNESAAIGTCDQISLRIHSKYADVRFIALEEYGVIAPRRYAINLSAISRRNK